MSSPADGLIGARRWALFAVTWAAAVLFHLAGNTRVASSPIQLFVGAAAIAVLARPQDLRLVAALAVAVLAGVWAEAPVLGNHWLLHGLVAGLVLGTVAVRRSPAAAFGGLVGPARLTLLTFYAFAAFSKLNYDFFEPSVSCAVFYLKEAAASWGIHSLSATVDGGAGRAVAGAVAGIELTIPILLIGRRTRRFGVVLALAFHFVLALDREHQFFDFSALLVCLFLLFLSDGAAGELIALLDTARERVERLRPSASELLHLLGLGMGALVVVIAGGPRTWPAPIFLRDVGIVVWVGYGVATAVLAAMAIKRSPAVDPARLVHGSWLLAIPLLSLGNGLTPYLEVKSGTSWNMYANLAVVDGSSNHLIVRRGFPITDGYEHLVEVRDTNDAGLRFYLDTPWRLPEVQLTDYLASHPGTWVLGSVDGDTRRFAGGDGRPEWRRKFQVFRAVDTEGPVACQPSFGPAR